MIGLDANVLARYCGFTTRAVVSVLRHLLGLRHVTVEDHSVVEQAVENCDAGVDFADALHHASYKACEAVATFDDRRFARRARKLGMTPVVTRLP